MYIGSISREAQRSMICIIAVRINLPPLHRFLLFNTIERAVFCAEDVQAQAPRFAERTATIADVGSVAFT